MVLAFVFGTGCGSSDADRGRSGGGDPGVPVVRAEVAFADFCTATAPEVVLVTPDDAARWSGSEKPYCVRVDDTPAAYGGFDPLGLEGPCGAGDSVPPWRSSKDLYAIVTASGAASYTLHVATRIEETDDERCVGCYSEESGCVGTSSFRNLSRDVSLATPEGGGSRVVPLTEIQGLDFEHEVLTLVVAIELLQGDSVIARDTLAPDWPLCC